MIDVTTLFRLYARRRLAALGHQDAAQVQERQLLKLTATAAATRFGREHHFEAIRSVDDFRRQVPLRRYEDLWSTYWEPSFPEVVDATWPGKIPYFAATSGTTSGITKHIPVTEPMIGSNRRAGTDIFVHHVANRPRSRVMGGYSFMLGGSTALEERAPGVWSGDLSGIIASRLPWWARLRYFPPRDLESMTDWEAKIDAFAERSQDLDIRAISGVPSWMLLFFDRLAARRPDRGRSIPAHFPNLEMVIHGGVDFAPYRDLFADRIEGGHAETREVYAASEGFIAVADRGDGDGMRVVLDSGIFYEFVPVEELAAEAPTRHWIAEVETGVNYAIVLSTCAGVWASIIGDTVRFVDREPPRLLITGRTSYTLSAFGEHLIGEEVEAAAAAAAHAIDRRLTDFAVGAIYPDRDGELGGHLWIVEFAEGKPDEAALARFAEVIDNHLAESNDDYRVHRSRDYGMKAPRVHVLEPGGFAAWMKGRGQLGGQHKVPRIINDAELFDTLRDFAGCR
jgi:hypothetical protein